MFRYYERPTLLIEFEEGKSFSLQPFTTFKNGVLMRTTNAENTYVQRDLQLKLMVLLTSYPSLRILWTSSPFETAKLFKELKLNQNEPDVTEAVSKGLNPLFDRSIWKLRRAVRIIHGGDTSAVPARRGGRGKYT